MFCLWCGPVGILFWLVGFWLIGGLIPPPSPDSSASEIQKFYSEHTNGIRAGLVLTMIGASLTAPWVAVIAAQMKRIEGEVAPLTYLQLGTGMVDIVFFIVPVMNMQAAAFRPDRDPDLILLANDMGWLPFVGVWSVAFVQTFALGLVTFQDKESKVFPRWFGYYNFWTIFLFVPGSLLYFFKTGPFAWNGALSWWLVVAVFTLWFAVTLVVVRRAIISHPDESETANASLVAPTPSGTRPTVSA